MRQWKPYYYNEEKSSRTLHLYGGCKYSRVIYDGIRLFNTEDDVVKQVGTSYRWCEDCRKWKEQLIYNAIKEREDKNNEKDS